jgi:predicted ArsR family transcriptional regulator
MSILALARLCFRLLAVTTTLDPIRSIARLDDPVRRALYDWVAAQPDAVGRDEAAAAVGISRALAAFHLDRLVTDALLTAEYRRRTGRSGPGAGRPAKLYRRAQGTIAVSLPARDYALAARLLAEAVERSGPEGMPPPPAREAAREAGLELGRASRVTAGPRAGRSRRREALVTTLTARGYEPRETDTGELELHNCPFDALVHEHRPLVCGMNQALLDGALDAVGETGLYADLDPQPGRCCVVLREANQDKS